MTKSQSFHQLEVTPVEKGDIGAFLVSEYITQEYTHSHQIKCILCGEYVQVPGGKLLKDYITENFSADTYVKVTIRHRGGGDGKNPPPMPPGVRKLTSLPDSIMSRLSEKAKAQLAEQARKQQSQDS